MHTSLCNALLLSALAAAMPAHAAESYDNCTGFIDSLPAVVSTQGVWCLRKDLATGISDGAAITLANNNITIDCNHFKLGGLSAGSGTTTVGIEAVGRSNATVRHCNIRGFLDGVGLGGSGHLVEDNRFEGNTQRGITVEGDAGTIRRNIVLDTGGSTSVPGGAAGIDAYGPADILDNTVQGLSPPDTGGITWGIKSEAGAGGVIQGNRIRQTAPGVDDIAVGILVGTANQAQTVLDNLIHMGQGAPGDNRFGIACDPGTFTVARDNRIHQASIAINHCQDGGGNY